MVCGGSVSDVVFELSLGVSMFSFDTGTELWGTENDYFIVQESGDSTAELCVKGPFTEIFDTAPEHVASSPTSMGEFYDGDVCEDEVKCSEI